MTDICLHILGYYHSHLTDIFLQILGYYDAHWPYTINRDKFLQWNIYALLLTVWILSILLKQDCYSTSILKEDDFTSCITSFCCIHNGINWSV